MRIVVGSSKGGITPSAHVQIRRSPRLYSQAIVARVTNAWASVERYNKERQLKGRIKLFVSGTRLRHASSRGKPCQRSSENIKQHLLDDILPALRDSHQMVKKQMVIVSYVVLEETQNHVPTNRVRPPDFEPAPLEAPPAFFRRFALSRSSPLPPPPPGLIPIPRFLPPPEELEASKLSSSSSLSLSHLRLLEPVVTVVVLDAAAVVVEIAAEVLVVLLHRPPRELLLNAFFSVSPLSLS